MRVTLHHLAPHAFNAWYREWSKKLSK